MYSERIITPDHWTRSYKLLLYVAYSRAVRRRRPRQLGGRTKTTLNKTFQTKTPDKSPRQEPPGTKTNLPVKTYVHACMHVLLKIGRFRDVSRTLVGVPRCVTMCDRGGGSKLVQNSVTYFMDGPHDCVHVCLGVCVWDLWVLVCVLICVRMAASVCLYVCLRLRVHVCVIICVRMVACMCACGVLLRHFRHFNYYEAGLLLERSSSDTQWVRQPVSLKDYDRLIFYDNYNCMAWSITPMSDAQSIERLPTTDKL